MRPISPIQTRYKGHRFRSRLEARWAVFLDHLSILWEYETEGFEFPNGVRYLPDFWLPKSGVFLEIKRGGLSWGEREAEHHKVESLAVYEGVSAFIAYGHPGDATFEWLAQDRERAHMPADDDLVAFDVDAKTGLPMLWSAEHEPIFLDPITDPWGRHHHFTGYSGGFWANTYLVCSPDHPALEARRPRGLLGVTKPEEIPLSATAMDAIAAAKSARFEFGESGAG